jgi:hypothetical protein
MRPRQNGLCRAHRVTGSPDRGAIIAKTTELIEFARHHGYRRDELIALMRRLS